MTTSETPPQQDQVTFPSDDSTVLCSTLHCSNGHHWLPKLALARCPGCTAPVLALKMENCPFCNEPSTAASIRCDHFSKNERVQPLCKGAPTQAEVTMLDFNLEHWSQTEKGQEGSQATVPHSKEDNAQPTS